MKKILHVGADESKLNTLTVSKRWEWFRFNISNQVWHWRGGDAVVGLRPGSDDCWCVMRFGKEVKTFVGRWVSFKDCVEAFGGQDFKQFTIV
jgi:hypothetical protein